MENKTNPFKIVVIILSVITVVLVGVLIWISIDRGKMIADLQAEKESLTIELVELQNDYSELSSDNENLNNELDREREKVGQLLDRIKKTEAANLKTINEYKKELSTLRSIMKSYIVQIDSLNTLNIALREDAAKARQDFTREREKNKQLQTEAQQYAKQVEKGSVVRGRGLTMVAINSSNKETDRSSRVEKLKTCLGLVENSIAPKGPKTIYVRIKGPDGVLMTGEQQQFAEIEGELMIISASRQADYQGEDLEICIYFSSGKEFVKGVYTVDAYTAEGKLGSADMILR